MIIYIVLGCLYLLTIILYFMLRREIAKQFANRPSRRTPPPPPPPATYDPEDWEQLGRMLYGDWEAAQRLLNQTMADHPGRSLGWAIKKTIRDLEYDRSR